MINTPAHLVTEAASFAEARRNAVARGQGVAAEPSAPAAADPLLGQHGGIVLRELTTRGVVYPAGTILGPEVTMSWRPGNRAALQRQRRVLFLAKPVAQAPEKPE